MTKPKCLNALLNALPLRKYGMERAAKFVEKFPWRGFLVQAPQALQSLTGYGVVLGGAMAAATDLAWGLLRSPWSGLPRIDLPRAVDPVSKAIVHLATAPFHLFHPGVLSYEDHWILAAADSVAIQLLSTAADASVMDSRVDYWASIPFVQWKSEKPETLAVLSELGIDPAEPEDSIIPGLTAFSPVADVVSAIAVNFPNWLEQVRLEFPASTTATAFANVLSQAGHDFFTWSTGGEDFIKPIFEPEELAIARLFEYGVFPPVSPTSPEVDLFVQRAVELMHASARDYPSRVDVVEALDDIFGSHVER